MKQDLLTIVSNAADPAEKQNLMREYIQACALRSLHEGGAFKNLSFVGGTALRFLFALPRFSEDLDFSLESNENYDPVSWLTKMKRDFSRLGFEADITWNDRKTVHTGWIKIAGLLHECGLSARPEQKIAVKIEIDTLPPEGAITEKKIVNRHTIFAVRHHTLSCLMAGKIRALLTRPFQKGRDWYDLLWYLSRIPPVIPDSAFLSNALSQPGEVNYFKPELGWKGSVSALLNTLSIKSLKSDVDVFLENPNDADLFTEENFRELLSRG
ncbi:MAG TPA: nucleotidyl transferase AbiEii/AbiGii toxin family protein [Treponemataceae bacterium]|nr:nucleotidyl transferase AbiEii/AbiGii toxin family protein [Treponemataceae bacterium]HQL06006.1 nucleotidyl transferase AbiEii/AbiGii toxin family protein [Treponemataceae bacterium]